MALWFIYVTMVYGTKNSSYWVDKPTDISGGAPPCMYLCIYIYIYV